MQKRTFLAVLAVSLAVTGIFLGAAAARLVSIRSSAAPAAGARPSRPEPPRGGPASPETWGNLFAPGAGMTLPSKIAGGGKNAAASAPLTTYTLVGTIVSDDKSRRRAILWAEGMKTPRMFRESDEIEPGVRLASVERSAAWLARGAVKEKLELLPVGSKTRTLAPPAAPGAAPASPASPAGGASDIRVTKLKDNVYGLDEAGVAHLTGNFNQYLSQVRLIPYFEGNKASGYRVAAVRPGSTFEQLGFQGGDVIQQVNSLDISSPDKMFTIFQNLKDEKKVTVNILRQGVKSTITYEIR